MTFVFEKMKLASFSFFRWPKMPFGQLNVAIQIYNIYNIYKGRLGSRGVGGGGGGCISERRHQIYDENRPLCRLLRMRELWRAHEFFHWRTNDFINTSKLTRKVDKVLKYSATIRI